MSTKVKRFNKQKIFDIVTKHLLTQNAKCSDGFGGCKYRHCGASCAIGCLIPDEAYTNTIEDTPLGCIVTAQDDMKGISVGCSGSKPVLRTLADTDKAHHLRNILNAAVGAKTVDHFVFLRTLQRVHDVYPVDKWEKQLRVVADAFSLTYKEYA